MGSRRSRTRWKPAGEHICLALLYPTIGFALWHFAPQSIFPSPWRGGRVAFVVQAGFLGLLFGWVANDTGVILWTAISHILIDFSALGWDVYFK